MADENTTDLTPTPTDPPVENPTPEKGSEPSSTTESPEKSEGETLLTGASGEAKPEGEDEAKPEPTEEEKAAKEAHDKLFGAPEGDYEISGLPDDMEIDKAALEAVTPVAKELGLSNEGFSKLANVYATQVMPKVVDGVVDNLQKDISAQHATWATESLALVKADPVFAGKPLTEVQSLAAKSLDRFGGPEFRKFLDDTGLGNHPAMMKFAYMAGTMLSEDTTFERGGKAPSEKARTEKYYGPQS